MNVESQEITSIVNQDDSFPKTPPLREGVTKDRNQWAFGRRSSEEGLQEVVLIVNDIPDQLDLMATLLQQSGYQIITAVDGYQGYEVALTERPDLIISDVTMP